MKGLLNNRVLLNLANALVKAEAKIDLCGPCLGKVNTFIHEELGK